MSPEKGISPDKAEKKPRLVFHVHRQKDGARQYYWHLKAGNHEIVANGELYQSEAACLRAIDLVRSCEKAGLVVVDGENVTLK